MIPVDRYGQSIDSKIFEFPSRIIFSAERATTQAAKEKKRQGPRDQKNPEIFSRVVRSINLENFRFCRFSEK